MKHRRLSSLLTAPPPQGTPLPPAGAGGQSIVWCGCENTWDTSYYRYLSLLSSFLLHITVRPAAPVSPGSRNRPEGPYLQIACFGKKCTDMTFQTRSSVCLRPRTCRMGLLDTGWSRGSQLQGCRGHWCRSTWFCTQEYPIIPLSYLYQLCL